MATIFVNPRWNTNDDPITVYVSGDLVYNDSGHGGTEATCYSTFEKAYGVASSAATIYVYNAPDSPLSISAPSGTYSQQLSSPFSIEKNLYVRAGIFQVGSVEHYTYSFNIIGDYTVDFGVTESFNIAQNTIFNVWNGANFQLGSTGSGTSVSFENSGTVCVSNGATFQAGTTSITNNVEIEVTGSAFSVASVTNNGTFKVEGASKLEIGNLSGTITLNNENVTLNASSITGGNISATAYGAIFTGANTLNGVALNATGKTVTVGDTASLTVKGTSTLNIGTLSGTIKTGSAGTTLTDSSITGGSISAQDDLTFTGANTLNGISLDVMVANKTVTIGTGEGDSLTVGGKSTLNIGTLNGEIKTASNTTLQNSNITGGSITALGLVSITVKNSTISSNVFTTTESGVDFSGACILDGVNLDTGNNHSVNVSSNDTLTISGGTLSTGSLYGNGTVTVTGENELHIGNLYGDGIKLDGATIKNSSIVGMYKGGTLLVESGKTATFSGSNNMSATSISNSGTINVNGTLSTGTIDNTNGTIALNGGARVASAISGGSITTSNTGTVTVQYSTISSSAFTATADKVIFYDQNTLNGVTLDATGKTVTVNGTLTLTGANTLNATNITSGIISAQDNLTFTGTNTLNGVTLNATVTGKTVTVGTDEGDSLTVEGTNTLNIGTLDGTIKTDADALTTLNASSITGGSISAQNDLTFTGANTLNSVTLNAANKTVTNTGTLTVGGTSTLNIGTLNGEIKTGSAGTTLTGSTIIGGANGGTITALGALTFANYTHLRNITLDAHDQTVDAGYNLWLGGAITLKIGNLISTILLDEDTTFTNSTISNGNDSSSVYIYGGKVVTFAGANTIFDAKVHATGRITNDGSITVESNDDKGELTVYRIENSGSITVGSAGSDNEAADACSLTGTLLNNGGTITVNGGKGQNDRSLLDAAYITNGDNNNHTGMMSLTNAVLNATKLENYGRGTFDPGPPRTFQAAITISDSIVSITDSLTNGAANNTSATIEFNNSTVTADSVTNYGTHNGTDENTGKVGFALTDCTFTVNNTLTNYGWIYVISSTLQATSLVNNGNRFYVYGTSTLNIGTLTGRIDIINGNDTGSLVTLNNSHITGKVNDDGSLGSSIYVSNPLTFTGTNTLTNTQFYATAANKTVTVDSGATLTVKGTSKLNIASLNGTILTDADDLTTLKDSSITGGGTNGGTITAQGDLTFTGANTLNSVTLNAANKTVTNTGTLTVGGTLSFNGNLNVAGNASLAVGNGAGMTVTGNISNSGSITVTGTGSLSAVTSNINNDNNGTITVDALSTLKAETVSGGRVTVKRDSSQVLTEDVYHVVDANLQNVTVGFIGDLTDYTFCPSFVDSGLYLFKKDPSTVYVNGNYPAQPNTLTDGHLVGVNAFTNNPDGTETSLHFSNNTEKIVYYANANAYAALNLAVDNAPANLTITTEAVGSNEVVTMGPLTIGSNTKNQTVTLSGAKMTLTDATEPAAASLSVSSGSTLNVGGESASGLTAQTVNNAGTINVTNSTFAASTVSTSAVDDRFFVAGESTLNIDSLNGKIKLNDGATVSNSTVYSDVNVVETTTSCSGRLVIATGSSVTFAGANTFRDSNNEKGIEIGNLGSVTVKSIAASGDDPAASDYVPAKRGVLKVFGFDNIDTLTVGSNSDACTFDVINLNNHHALTVNGKTDDLSRLKASSVENYGTIELTNAIAEAGSLQNGNASNTTTTIEIANSEFSADSVTNYSSGISNVREGMTVTNSTLFQANSLVNNGTIKFRGKNKLDIGSLSGTLFFDVAEGTQATLNDSSITGGTLQAVSVMKFTGANTLTNITVDAAYMGVTVGTDEGDSLTVSGTNTLIIKELNGTITTTNSATLQNSNITGGAITALASVTVNNSTISSNTFTCNAESYFGVTFTGENTLDSVTLNAGYVTNGGSLTVKGESELHIGDVEDNNRENGTIKLDGATIINSSIVGGAHGGTLLVESGKTATFSTTGSNNNNNLANTSIINSGTVSVSGSMNSGAITNTSGTITVNGTLNSGAITNTNGTITVNGTLNSGAITNTSGTITVNGKMTCGDITNNAYSTFTLSNADVTAGTVTNLAEGLDSTGAQITVTDSSFTASTVSVNFYADFHVSGESTLDIGNLNGTIRLNDGATISNSAVYAAVNKGETTTTYQGKLLIAEGSNVTLAGENTFLSDDRGRGSYLEIKGAATVKSTFNKKGNLKAYFINNNTLGGNLTVGSETDACSLDAIALYNRGAITVQGNKNDQERSNVSASEIKNEDDNAWMTFIYSELTAATIKNYGRGTFDPGPPRTSQAAITISDSIVSITDSLTNGAANTTSATIEFNNSTVTADSVTNYGIDNGTGGNTGRAGFIVNDSTFTANNTLTNHGWFYVFNSTLHATSLVNNNKFCVYGTSTLNIGTLTGRIDIINGNATGSLVTLTDSHITGKVNGDGSLGSSIYVSNPLTFTGTNTLTNTQFFATAANKTVTVDSGATLTVKGTSKLNIASLNGTILTDADDLTTLKDSSITGGTISAQNSLAFTGANTLNRVTLSAAGQAVTVDSGATLTVGGTSTLNIGTLDGTITVANGATLSNSSVNGTVKVQSGATMTLDGVNAITTLDLSAANAAVTMDWQDQLSFTGFGTSTSYTDKLTINLNNFTSGDLSKPILDSVNNDWTKDMYEALLTNAWSSSDPGSTQYTFKVVNGDLYLDLQEIVVNGGTHSTISVLNGVPVEIVEKNDSTTLFKRGVFGGADTTVAAGSSDTPVEQGIDVAITGGTFEKLIAGGSFISLEEADYDYYVRGSTQSVSISGGKIENTVAAGDRLQKGTLHRVGNLDMKITGGTFTSVVSGGMMNILADTQSGHAYIDGDIDLKITGGTFTDNCWIYGGNVSSNKATISANSEINGSVTITIDAAAADTADEVIVLSHIIAGSHGYGKITGKVQADESLLGTKIVFLGDGVDDGNAVVFAKNKDNKIVGELWGSSSGDVLDPITKKINSSVVEGDRILSFMGFNGQLDCANIRAFSKIEIKNRIKTENNETSTIKSTVTLDNANFNLSGVEKWEIDCGSTLSGNFINNFAGDTLNLIGFNSLNVDDQMTILTDLNISSQDTQDVFNGFDSKTFDVWLAGTETKAEWDSVKECWYWGASESHTYELGLTTSTDTKSMVLTRIA